MRRSSGSSSVKLSMCISSRMSCIPPAGYVLRVTSPDDWPSSQICIRVATWGAITVTLFGDPGAEDGSENAGRRASAGTRRSRCSRTPRTARGTPQRRRCTSIRGNTRGRSTRTGDPDFSDPNWLEAKSELPATTGCELLQFNPSLTAAPETTAADSPTGLTTHLSIPQAPNNDLSLATADLKSATVALPAGLGALPVWGGWPAVVFGCAVRGGIHAAGGVSGSVAGRDRGGAHPGVG